MSLHERITSLEHRLNLLEHENRVLHHQASVQLAAMSELSSRVWNLERGIAILLGSLCKAHWMHPLMTAARRNDPVCFRFTVNIKTNVVQMTMVPKNDPVGDADAEVIMLSSRNESETPDSTS